MYEYKITKEKLRAMAKECPEAKKVLAKGFPEAFEEQWENITEEVGLKWTLGDTERYFLRLYFEEKNIGIVYPDERGICVYDTMNVKFKIAKYSDTICILKKRELKYFIGR